MAPTPSSHKGYTNTTEMHTIRGVGGGGGGVGGGSGGGEHVGASTQLPPPPTIEKTYKDTPVPKYDSTYQYTCMCMYMYMYCHV